MGRPKNCDHCHKSKPCACGRPTKMTDDTVGKLREAFAIDATVEEACFYAGINKSTYYDWAKANPELSDEMEALRQKPVLKARTAVVRALDDPQHAFRYLSAKRPREFNPAQKVEHSGNIEVADLTERMGSDEKAALAALRAARRKRIEAESDEMP